MYNLVLGYRVLSESEKGNNKRKVHEHAAKQPQFRERGEEREDFPVFRDRLYVEISSTFYIYGFDSLFPVFSILSSLQIPLKIIILKYWEKR